MFAALSEGSRSVLRNDTHIGSRGVLVDDEEVPTRRGRRKEVGKGRREVPSVRGSMEVDQEEV